MILVIQTFSRYLGESAKSLSVTFSKKNPGLVGMAFMLSNNDDCLVKNKN